MPKTLHIIRHAKSSWSEERLPDFERPLNSRGKRDAPFMAEVLKQKGVQADHILCSSARRTRKTAQYFLQALHLEEQITFLDNLYHAGPSTMLEVINDQNDEHDALILIGHNPGVSQLVYDLTNEMHSMPTCAIAGIHLTVDSWKEVFRGTGTLFYYDYPKAHL